MYDRQRIEITNVEDMKDVCNDFELPNFREQLQRKAIREQQYNNDKSLITSDLEMLRNEILERDNLLKLRDLLEYLEKSDPGYSLLSDKLYKDIVLEILNNFYDDLNNENISEDYNLIREFLKFVSFLEESRCYSKFFEIYNGNKNFKKKIKDKESILLQQLNRLVKVKQKKRKQDINKRKKLINEDLLKELSKNNQIKTNALLEEDYLQKKEEEMGKKKKNENVDLMLVQDDVKKEVKIEERLKKEDDWRGFCDFDDLDSNFA